MSEISYGGICLRPWRQDPADAAALIEIAQCAHVQAWLKDWQDVEEWAEPWIRGQAWRHDRGMPESEFMSWAITVPPSDIPIGVINLGGDEMDHQGVGLGYFLHENALHRGYATQAVLALCGYAFARWGFSEIYAKARVENRASRAVLERAGFTLLDMRSDHLPGYDREVQCAWYVKNKS